MLTNMTAKKSAKRRASGQAIIESACGTLIFVMVAVFIILGCVNIYAYMVNSQKVQKAADAAARVCSDSRFWFGQVRPDWDENEARQRAETAANFVLNQMGLPNGTIVEFSPGATETIGNVGFVCSHVKLTVAGLRLPYTSLGMPGVVNITCDGYSAEASSSPYATAVLSFVHVGDNDEYGRPKSPATTLHRMNFPILNFGNQLGANGPCVTPSSGVGRAGGGVHGKYAAVEAMVYGATGDLQIVDTTTGREIHTFRGW